MPANYGYERGKYGVFPGTIIAFPRSLNGIDPNDDDFKNYVPAGYLRCDGSVLPGFEYPNLKEILGVGQDSKFRKPSIVLEEDVVANSSGGQFQLPDLGSKYMKASSSSGLYRGDVVEDPANRTNVSKVGIATDLSLNKGTNFDMTYQGQFVIPQYEIDFLNNQNFGTTLGVTLDNGETVDSDYLMHGHYSNLPVWAYSNDEDYSENISVNDLSPSLRAINSVGIIGVVSDVAGEQENAVHAHVIDRTFPNRTSESIIPTTQFESFNVTTSVTLREAGTIKMDDLTPSFILVEYLIKF
jgi:hypothetical protein